jgi:hypothetical protein
MDFSFGFAHAYEFHYSLFPWRREPLEKRVSVTVQRLIHTGASWWRPHIPWNRIEPKILKPGLRPPDVTESLVEDYVSGAYPGVDWAETDQWVGAVTAAGVRLHIGLGIAYVSQLPSFERSGSTALFTPGVVDPEIYLGHLSLHARATVRRYKDKIRVWQLENELNNAAEVTLVNKWRKGKWYPWNWLTRVIETLCEAVKREDPSAVATHNFSCDTPDLGRLYSWRKDIERWLAYLDWVGIDRYPNYLKGRFNRGAEVGALACRVRDLVPAEKPLWVLETGIPAEPARKGFSEALQAYYYATVLDAVQKAGADGVLFYCFVSQEGYPGNDWHKRRPWNDVEDHWGLFRADDTPREAFRWLRRHFGPVSAAGSELVF